MTLAANWAPPVSWSSDEKRVFETLQSGVAFEARTNDERQAPRGIIPLTEGRPARISGAFLSEIVRKYTDEFPVGVQLQGVVITGEVQIENVRIDKILSLEHCYFTGPIIARGSKFLWLSLTGSVLTDYFDMRSSVISGAVFLRWGFQSLTCTLMRDATVTGPVDCDGAVFKYDSLGRIGDGEFRTSADGESFSLARASASALFWMNLPEPPTGIVNLRNLQIKSLRDHINNVQDVARDWPEPGNLRMSGLKYEERTSANPEALLAWIALQTETEVRYGSYQTTIKVLSDSGHELSANEIILAKQYYTAQREHSMLTKILRYIYIGLSKAGLGTDRIAAITAVAFVLSLIVIAGNEHDGQFIPKNSEILKDPCFDISKPCQSGWIPYHKFRVPPYYPAFNSLGYTIDMFVPGVSYGVSTDWRPRSDATTVLTLVIRVIGSLLIGLLIVCVSGIARFSR